MKVDKFWGKSGYFFEHIGERYYRVVYKYLQTEAAEDDNYLILYFEDITDTERQKLNSWRLSPFSAISRSTTWKKWPRG